MPSTIFNSSNFFKTLSIASFAISVRSFQNQQAEKALEAKERAEQKLLEYSSKHVDSVTETADVKSRTSDLVIETQSLNSDIKNLNADTPVSILETIVQKSEKVSKKAQELYEVINKKGGGGSSNTFSAVDFITDMQNYFASLSFVELTASINILGCVIILFCLSTIILILLSDYLINKLNISSNNFPRIYKILLLRRKIQLYSLIVDFSIIVVVVLTLIYINIIAMT